MNCDKLQTVQTGDKGQRYEIRAMDGAGEEFTIGWSNSPDAFIRTVELHPAWHDRRVIDRNPPEPVKPVRSRTRKGHVFGRLILTTCNQAANAPLADSCTSHDAEGNRYRGWAILLTPWRRAYGQSKSQTALVIGWNNAEHVFTKANPQPPTSYDDATDRRYTAPGEPAR